VHLVIRVSLTRLFGLVQGFTRRGAKSQLKASAISLSLIVFLFSFENYLLLPKADLSRFIAEMIALLTLALLEALNKTDAELAKKVRRKQRLSEVERETMKA